MRVATRTAAGGRSDWRIDDDITQLREWATPIVHALPAKPPATIGSLDSCWLTLRDESGRISRQHAQLACAEGRWFASDLKSKNGTRQDGAQRLLFPLTPGTELGIGGVTLVVESPRFIALRELVSRLVGWSKGRLADVDLALRAIRASATRRESLLLCGDGDLVAIAQQLHRHAFGDERPFVVCDPRRRTSETTARAAANHSTGLRALAAAAGGTLCIWQDRQPDDFPSVMAAVRDPSSCVQLVVCTHALHRTEPLIATPIILAPLAGRNAELDRVIAEYGAEAAVSLGGTFARADHDWIRREEAATLTQIERAARRLVAIRSTGGSITRAASMLAMSHAALSEWVARRALPA